LKGFGSVYRRWKVDAALFEVFGEVYSVGCCKGGHGVVVKVVSSWDGKGEGEEEDEGEGEGGLESS
jgi:hypothetical protein